MASWQYDLVRRISPALQQACAQLRLQCSQWRTVFAAAGVTERDIEFCARYVMRGWE